MSRNRGGSSNDIFYYIVLKAIGFPELKYISLLHVSQSEVRFSQSKDSKSTERRPGHLYIYNQTYVRKNYIMANLKKGL